MKKKKNKEILDYKYFTLTMIMVIISFPSMCIAMTHLTFFVGVQDPVVEQREDRHATDRHCNRS